jgi:THUMP domain-containing protein/methyltransferase family protein
MPLSLSQLRFLQSPSAETALRGPLPGNPLASQVALRKSYSVEEAAAIETLRLLRDRARSSKRLPGWLAESMLATDTLLQQASSYRLGVHVGRILARMAGEDRCYALCSGLGVDAIGMARGGAEVLGIDRSPEAVLCAEHNARVAGVSERCRFEQADVTSMDLPPAGVVHCDPDRRATGKRAILLEHSSPGPEFLLGLPQRTRAGAMKLSPALDRNALPRLSEHLSLEYLSERGTCRQLLAWWGVEPTGPRATIVSGAIEAPESHTISDDGLGLAQIRRPGALLYEPDPAVIAAGCEDSLARQAGLWRIGPHLAWLGGEQLAETPFARAFRVLGEAPGRLRDVSRLLRKLGGGRVSVKTRGLKLDTDSLQRRLSGKGERQLVVLWYRIDSSQRTIVAEPVPDSATPR